MLSYSALSASSQAESYSKLPAMDSFLQHLKSANILQQKTDLVPFDLIPPDDEDRIIVDNKLIGKEQFSNFKEAKSFGCFIGTAMGAIGLYTTGIPLDYQRNTLKGFENVSEVCIHSELLKMVGQYRIETSMSLCIADSLLQNNLKYDGKDLRFRFLLWYYSGYNNGKNKALDSQNKCSIGVGAALYNSFIDFIKNKQEKVESYGRNDENGNGSIMRLAPFAIAFHNNLEKCLDFATQQSYTTHNGTEAAECCKLISFVAWNFLNIDSPDECKAFLEKLGELFRSDCKAVQCLAESRQEDEENLALYNPKFNKSIQDRYWNWKNPNFRYSAYRTQKGSFPGIYCMDATAMAFHTIYHTSSFKEALLKVVNLGGDAQTLGSMVGMLAGAMYGYEEDMQKWYLEYVAKWDEKKCPIRAYKLFKLAEK